MNQFRAVIHTFQKAVSPRVAIPTHKCSKYLAAGALALVLGLLVVALNCHAMEFYWTNTTSVSTWSDCLHTWYTNGIGIDNGNCYPGQNFGTGIDDAAIFTNGDSSGTYAYTVSIDVNPATVGSNFLSNASNTTATVTFELNGTNCFNPQIGGPVDAFVIAEKAGSTTTVYMSSWGSAGTNGYIGFGKTAIGRNGVGTLILTNGIFNTGTVDVGDCTGGRGTLVVYSPTAHVTNNAGPYSVILTNTGQLVVGHPNSSGNSVVISNSGKVFVTSTMRIGSSDNGVSSDNTVTIDSGGLLCGANKNIIGKRCPGVGGLPGSYNNVLLVKSNGTFDGKNHSFQIGWYDDDVDQGPATGNVVRVMAGGGCTNLARTVIRSNNMVDLQGGVFGSHLTNCLRSAQGGSITDYGVIQGWGRIQTPSLEVGGMLYAMMATNQLRIAIANELLLDSGSTLQVELGTNYNPILVTTGTNNAMTVLGANSRLNVIDSGGLTPCPSNSRTYTILAMTNASDCAFFSTNSPAITVIPPGMVLNILPSNSCCTYSLFIDSTGRLLQLTVMNTCPPLVPPEFRITSITRSNSDVTLTWVAPGGTTDRVQAALGTNYASVAGNYRTDWSDIFNTNLYVVGCGNVPMTYTDPYFATNNNAVSRFYRIRQVP